MTSGSAHPGPPHGHPASPPERALAPPWLDSWAGDEHLATLEVAAFGEAAAAVERHTPVLVADGVAARITDRDPTLWGVAAQEDAERGLGWVDLPRGSRPLVGEIEALREELAQQGLDEVLLCGMGGASLAAEVLARTAGVRLAVLDGTDPAQVRSALEVPLERTVVVVSSKSGTTVETDSQRRAVTAALEEAGLDASAHLVAVTDPGSELEQAARTLGYRAVFLADDEVCGRFSALSAYGLVPAGLAGVDVGALLDEADVVADLLADDSEGNPALVLGAALAGTEPLHDKIVLVEDGSRLPGMDDWVEQLLAESTGKDGAGLLPVVVEGPQAPEVTGRAPDVLVVHLSSPTTDEDLDGSAPGAAPAPGADTAAGAGSARGGGADAEPTEVTVAGPLGAQFLLWEYATAVASRLLRVNPFDQPDVERTKVTARSLLDAGPVLPPPDLVDGPVELRGPAALLAGAGSLAAAVEALLAALGPHGYLAVTAHLDRTAATARLASVRAPLARRTGRPVTFGWGPRYLHSTGQYHKGGPDTGVFLAVTGAVEEDLPVPGRPFTFGRLLAAQAAADADVLAGLGRPVLRVHLSDRAAGLERLLTVLGEERR